MSILRTKIEQNIPRKDKGLIFFSFLIILNNTYVKLIEIIIHNGDVTVAGNAVRVKRNRMYLLKKSFFTYLHRFCTV